MKHQVAIVDDHLLIAKAIGSIINNFSGFETIYEVENGKVLIEKLKNNSNKPELILMDISMPEMNGFETTEWLTEQHPEITVMALSVQDDEDSLIKMIKAGAKGYLHKNVHPAELELALKTIIDRGMYFPNWATSKVFANISKKDTTNSIAEIKINDREMEFLKHTCSELTYKEIADIMCCSPRTVEGYRDSLFEKLMIKTRVGLAMYAIKSGIVKL
ncbi:response regulator transcription factor [Lacihabitans soyangensis]|uniref:DNA-binding response regulator n=1 Tax=Lacihabitans soyangensis TaxID=869394 RepID=A0AAE3H2H8_9BACT|nr:response regulator transcription factor [Lacihabitans soyangensis]MCP9762779.1 DNA-binding response regulator [Lacihabitans soyangensis]